MLVDGFQTESEYGRRWYVEDIKFFSEDNQFCNKAYEEVCLGVYGDYDHTWVPSLVRARVRG